MSKLFLGNSLADLDVGEPSLPVSKVILNVDSETYYQSGDDTGAKVEANCPWATQAMADNVLSQIKGFVYKPFSGYDALLDPSAELGDAITVGGHYGVLAQMGRRLDRQAAAAVGAPGIDEIEDEYPYKTKQRKETDRVLAKAYSRITKTAEEILLEVTGLNDKYTSLSVTIDGVTVKDETGATRIKGSSIETDTLYVNAANITGTLTADQIRLSGSITWDDLSGGVQSTINGAYTSGLDAEAVNTLITSTLVSSPTIKGGEFYDSANEGRLTLSTEDARFAWLTFESVQGNREIFSVGGSDYGGTMDVTLMTFADVTIFSHYTSTGKVSFHNVNIESPLSDALESTTIIAKLKSVLGLS